jgi:hypothetical protein
MADRTVHARYDGMEIVRYDRAGKWYLEPTNPRLPRQRIGVKDAARSARWGESNANGSVSLRLLGGAAFDRAYRRIVLADG